MRAGRLAVNHVLPKARVHDLVVREASLLDHVVDGHLVVAHPVLVAHHAWALLLIDHLLVLHSELEVRRRLVPLRLRAFVDPLSDCVRWVRPVIHLIVRTSDEGALRPPPTSRRIDCPGG